MSKVEVDLVFDFILMLLFSRVVICFIFFAPTAVVISSYVLLFGVSTVVHAVIAVVVLNT